MRLLFFHALVFVASLVAATDNALARDVEHSAVVVGDAPALQKRVCYFWILCFPDKPAPTPQAPVTVIPSSTPVIPVQTSSSVPADVTFAATEATGPAVTVSSSPAVPVSSSSAVAGSANSSTAAAATTIPPSVTTAPPSSSAAPSTFSKAPKSWSYPQPPLPARTVSAPSSLFTASMGGSYFTSPRTRYFTLNLQHAQGAPSGFQRAMMTINGVFPAPLIEANRGDTLVITVNNNLDLPQSLHWHGIRQNYTNSEDGVPGISQCSIQPGKSYTYRFTLDTEVGTYWYHSHYSNTYADGLSGAIVVHDANTPYNKYKNYDDERIMYLSDWMNDQSEVIAHGLLNENLGYRGSAIPPDPDAILINGKGQSDCAAAQAGVRCFTTDPSVTKVKRGNKVRFRLINHGAHATIRYSIDNHMLSIVEVDDTMVQPVNVKEVTIAPGQRMSVIVTMNQGRAGDAFWIRATTASACLNPLNVISTRAILWYTDFLGLTWFSNGIPRTQKWGDLANPATAPCRDTDQEHKLVPMIREDSPRTAVQAHSLNSAFGRFVHANGVGYIGFGYNDVAFTNYINNPLLSQVEKGLELNGAHVASVTYDKPTNAWSAVDLIINNKDPAFLAHPFHIHGRPFHILARGQGAISSETIPTLQLNTVNPIRRDTLVIGGNEWVLLRFITDNPGVWPIHCHIGWHLAVGKLGVLVMRPDEIKKFTQPGAWSGLCAGTDPNEIGPAKRSLPPQARNYDLEERYPGGVQDFTPTPEGATRGEYQANGTHWWVVGTEYNGVIPIDQQVPEKRHWLESRTVFMNGTHWWIPGTVFQGTLHAAEAPDQKPATAPAYNAGSGTPGNGGSGSDGKGNVVIVSEGDVVPGPGNALIEPAEIIGGQVVKAPAVTFVNALPPGFTPSGNTKPEPTK